MLKDQTSMSHYARILRPSSWDIVVCRFYFATNWWEGGDSRKELCPHCLLPCLSVLPPTAIRGSPQGIPELCNFKIRETIEIMESNVFAV